MFKGGTSAASCGTNLIYLVRCKEFPFVYKCPIEIPQRSSNHIAGEAFFDGEGEQQGEGSIHEVTIADLER